MNEDRFNISIRKFLKEVGVTSQREIEKAVRERVDGAAPSPQRLNAKMTLEIASIGLVHVVDGEIELA